MSKSLEHLIKLLNQEADLIDRSVTNDSFLYKSTQRLVLKNGISFEKKIKSPFKGEPKQCYPNCLRVLYKNPSLYYCEGFAAYNDISFAIAHAWLVNEKGQVIDPTWWKETDLQNCAYFGVVFDEEFVMEMADKLKVYGILENDFMNEHKLKREGFPTHALSKQFHSNT